MNGFASTRYKILCERESRRYIGKQGYRLQGPMLLNATRQPFNLFIELSTRALSRKAERTLSMYHSCSPLKCSCLRKYLIHGWPLEQGGRHVPRANWPVDTSTQNQSIWLAALVIDCLINKQAANRKLGQYSELYAGAANYANALD